MRHQSWQKVRLLGLLLAIVMAGCLGVGAWHWHSARSTGEGASVFGHELLQSTDEGEPSQDDGHVPITRHEDEAIEPSDGRDSAANATGNGISVSVCEGELEQVATHLLASYRDARNCVLVSCGYLDLLGLVWGCVVQGDGWVDVCMVAQDKEENSCKVSVLHMEASEVAEVLRED